MTSIIIIRWFNVDEATDTSIKPSSAMSANPATSQIHPVVQPIATREIEKTGMSPPPESSDDEELESHVAKE